MATQEREITETRVDFGQTATNVVSRRYGPRHGEVYDVGGDAFDANATKLPPVVECPPTRKRGPVERAESKGEIDLRPESQTAGDGEYDRNVSSWQPKRSNH